MDSGSGAATQRTAARNRLPVWLIGAGVLLFVVLAGFVLLPLFRSGGWQQVPFPAGSTGNTGNTGNGGGTAQGGQPPRDTGVSLRDVAQSPRRYVGTLVTVEGQIGEVFSPRVFTLRDPGLLSGATVLVVNASDVPLGFSADSGRALEVAGRVYLTDQQNLGAELGVNVDVPLDRLQRVAGLPIIRTETANIRPAVRGGSGS